MASVTFCPDTGKRFELRMLSGEVLPYDVDRICRRIYENSTIGLLLPYVASAVGWPRSHVQLVAGSETFSYRQLLWDEQQQTLLRSLAGNDEVLTITVVKLSPESLANYPDLCLCDFDGCCVAGGPHCTHDLIIPGCRICGQDSCCRSGDCHHPCCQQAQRGKPSSTSRPCAHTHRAWWGRRL